MVPTEINFGIWDYVIVVLVMLISASIGVYYRFTGGRQKTMQEYLLADKNMSIIPVAVSLMASFMSAVTLLGVSSENYTFGFQFIVINISYGIFTPVAAYVYLPIFFRLQLTSAYEYLELRFGKTARITASLAYTFQMTLYMGIVVYAPALAMEALTGISRVAAVLSMGLVCTFYSTIGGMKAVLITDIFQSALMFVSVYSVIFGALSEKSFAEIWRIAEQGGRTDLLNFDIDPTVRHSWFTLIIGGGITFLSLYGVNQVQVQRYLTIKDLKGAQKALWLNWPILTALSLSTSFAGLCIYSKYFDCDPVKSGYISTSDQLMPYFVIDTMGKIPGLSGLFVAGIFSAALSTVSSALNSLAAVTMEDYYKPLYRCITGHEISSKSASFQAKLVALLYGLVCVGVTFLAENLGGVLQAALTIFGIIGGPLLGLFSLGMFSLTANEGGAVSGVTLGCALASWMAFGPKPPAPVLPTSIAGCNLTTLAEESFFNMDVNATDSSQYLWVYRVSYLYNGVAGLLTTFLAGFLISWVIRLACGKTINQENYDSRLFIPMIAKKVEKININKTNLKINEPTAQVKQ
ncbi:putative sodium-dependent multivitamin transporter [Anthonomus grandis grandis]|uniref:putative sodium-dependent multivitamin transporter n=1 Tax=Anthonomus grandis grandis TaxID=2921223 RepID=UPI002166B1B4|nr:putative sodium-dependent multivitamin transporter [Anthonomus grandis grandis]